MNKPCCGQPADRPAPKQRTLLADVASWALPGVLLAATPKCPMCVAAYVAIASGIGLSLATATALWSMLLLLCVVSLAYAAARSMRRLRVASRFEPEDTPS